MLAKGKSFSGTARELSPQRARRNTGGLFTTGDTEEHGGIKRRSLLTAEGATDSGEVKSPTLSQNMRQGWGTRFIYFFPKLNRSIKLPMAGLFSGTYGFSFVATGLGKLSRLRSVTGARCQLASMNFRIET